MELCNILRGEYNPVSAAVVSGGKQKEPGRSGCLGGVDKKLADKEERTRYRRLEEEERIVRNRHLMAIASTSTTNVLECTEDSVEQILNSELNLPEFPDFE
ncbi:hypothetical protein EVAR_41756_1 [Eumeta japonica]|uniref:Uncharacterized protein n=1 Tax=Eumeta variegata TaxID=151549 RepID=A0A4C1VZ85_EUMVA|nr:hypothetical protein EVAR_41756_1 [Eumeta japonica]